MVNLRWEGRTVVSSSVTNWSYDIEVAVSAWKSDGTSLGTETRTLHLDYESGHQAEYKDWDMLRLPGVHRMEIKVLSISYDDGAVSTMVQHADLYLEGAIDVERYFSLDQSSIFSLNRVELNQTNRTIEHAWTYEEGAEEYDFEFLFVSKELNSAAGFTIANTKDWNNATRVTLLDNSYKQELPYERGELFFRVRTVGIANKAMNQEISILLSRS